MYIRTPLYSLVLDRHRVYAIVLAERLRRGYAEKTLTWHAAHTILVPILASSMLLAVNKLARPH